MKILICSATAAASAVFAITCSAASYTITDLGTLGGDSIRPTGISAAGHVAGYAKTSNGNSGSTHAFLYANGVLTDLGTFGGKNSRASDINAQGEVTGYALLQNTVPHAFVYSQGVMNDLGPLGQSGTSGMGISSSGLVVGSWASAGTMQPFVYNNGSMSPISGFSNPIYAKAVNSQGQVVLNSRTDTQQQVYVYQNGVSTDIGSLGGKFTVGADINDDGTIVGWSTNSTSTTAQPRAFMYKDGQFKDLGTLANQPSSSAEGINSHGDVVGLSSTQFGEYTAFLYRNGAMIDLNNEIPIGSGWYLSSAAAINDQGQIVGYGERLVGTKMVERAFLLTPVPEPSTRALGAIGIVALLAIHCRRRQKDFPFAAESDA